MKLEQSVRYVAGVAIIDIRGEIIGDARFDSEKIIKEIIKSKPEGIILNLDEVPMVDSVWLGILVARAIDLEREGKKLVLLNAGRSVRYLLVVTKLEIWSEHKLLSTKIERYDDEGEAIASFKKK